MAYVQYTRCVRPSDKLYPLGLAPSALLAAGALATLIAGGGLTPYTAIPLLSLLIAYCWWWLNDRLICLGGDRCAIGLLGSVEPPEAKSGFDAFDTDYSINLVLAPHNIQETPADYPASVPPPGPLEDAQEHYRKQFRKALHRKIADDGIQGDLIREQAATASDNWAFEGYIAPVPGSQVLHHHQPYLHCEFEGGGIYLLDKAAKAALVASGVAAVVCLIPFIGWALCALASAIAVAIAIVGVIAALNDKGKPSVIDPAFPGIHTGRDILFVRGTWVYDSAHQGWNEIHPIKDCLLVGHATYLAPDKIDWELAIANYMISVGKWKAGVDPFKPEKLSGPPSDDDWKDWVKACCDASSSASSALTTENQSKPEHKWHVHPLIDGCVPSESIPPNTEPGLH
ncbi:hypothetical protein EHS39_28265 [Ensifer sp. MPMI2T]|nr:hypothetical protein EHS39_28265 [Ensifer sp. MPMI2T]